MNTLISPARNVDFFLRRLSNMKFYSPAEADRVAETFFKYYYHDRGKIKWGGFLLSEHTAAIRKEERENKKDK